MKATILDTQRKIMVKLTRIGVNFINILRTNFLYKCCFGSFSLVTCTSKKLPKQRLYEKFVSKMLVKLTRPGRRKSMVHDDAITEKLFEKWMNKVFRILLLWKRRCHSLPKALAFPCLSPPAFLDNYSVSSDWYYHPTTFVCSINGSVISVNMNRLYIDINADVVTL